MFPCLRVILRFPGFFSNSLYAHVALPIQVLTTHLKLLAMKNKVLQAYQDFEAWAKLHFEIQAFKYLQSNWGGEYLGKEFCSYLSAQGTKQKIMVHDDESHSFLQLEKTKSTHFYQQLISTSSIDIQLTYNQHPIDSKEAKEDF